MRLLGRLVAVVAAVAAVLAAAGYLLPREITVTREIVIEAPPERVFPHVNSLRRMAAWSSGLDIDPTMQRSYAGPRQGVGNRMSWTSGDHRLGRGHQEIVVSIPNRHVETVLDFDSSVATSWHDLAPTDGGTRVTWGLRVDLGAAPTRRYLGVMLRRRIGANHEEDLLRLKELIEAE
jgi:hypothetical protein